jgi:hypothetical protein
MNHAPDNTGLCWDSYQCECGGIAPMGIMSLVAYCLNCPRVYVHAKGWYRSIYAANEAERAGSRAAEGESA